LDCANYGIDISGTVLNTSELLEEFAMHYRFDSHARSAALFVAICICGVSLSAQSPFDQPLMAIERGATGIALYALATIIVVFSGIRWAVGGGSRHLAGVGAGLTLAFFVREILAWIWHV